MANSSQNGVSPIKRIRDAFEGMKGRQPSAEQELRDWLASDEGKLATVFDTAEVYFWGEMHAGAVRNPAEEEKFRSDLLHE